MSTSYVVIEMEGSELVGLHVCADEAVANDIFDSLANGQEYDADELENEIPGTLRLAGDDVHSVQLVAQNTRQVRND